MFDNFRMFGGYIFTLGGVGFDIVEILFPMIHQSPPFGQNDGVGKRLGRKGTAAGCTVELHEMMFSRPWFCGAIEEGLE